jgi:Ankyrin repeats (3 copies)
MVICDVNNSESWTALHYAVNNKYKDTIEYLLVWDATIYGLDTCGWSALYHTAGDRQKEIVEFYYDVEMKLNKKKILTGPPYNL